MKRLMLFALALFYAQFLIGQEAPRTYRYFATQQIHKQILEQDSAFDGNLQAMEQLVAEYGNSGDERLDTLPIVFHILYSEGENYPNVDHLLTQIDILNEGFGHFVPPIDAYVLSEMQAFSDMSINPGISFCAFGNTSDGAQPLNVNFIKTNVNEWKIGHDMKSSATGGVDPWSSQAFINVWICNLEFNAAGFAQMPGGPAATDGIVLDPDYLPGFAQMVGEYYGAGKSLVHLMGSYLGLYELWNDTMPCADDFVEDTPRHNAPNYGLADDYHHISLCDSTLPAEMVINFMDNTDDVALTMFTQGQKNRMKAILSDVGPRQGLAVGCDNTQFRERDGNRLLGNINFMFAAPSILIYPNPATNYFNIKIMGGKLGNIKIRVSNLLGALAWQGDYILENEVQVFAINGQQLQSGVYDVRVMFEDGTTINQMLDLNRP